MKLAEAIMLRADIQVRISRLRERIAANAKVQEGDQPQEAPADLLREALALAGELESLVLRINQRNTTATLADGQTITGALARRDRLMLQHSTVLEAIGATKPGEQRYSARELRWVPVLQAAQLEKQAESLAKELRELNVRIQEANWSHELPD